MPTYIPLSNLPFQYQDSVTSRNMSGGSIEFYRSGTATPTNLFSDSAGTSIGTSITLNSGGFPESGGNVITLFRDESIALRLLLKNAVGATIATSTIPAVIKDPYFEITLAEVTAGGPIVDYSYKPGHLYRYGTNTTPGTTDMTTALGNCYAACKAAVRLPMTIPAQAQRFTSKLTWNGSVDVIGENSEFSILLKDGNFDGIEIDGAGQEPRYSDFNLEAVNDVAGRGIVFLSSSHATVERITVRGQGGHGIELAGSSDTGFFSQYRNLRLVNNGGDGFKVGANHFASYFESIDSISNDGWGFNLITPAAYHVGKHIVCQQNTAGGAQVAGSTNSLEIYGEANTGVDITYTVTSVNNFYKILHTDTQADFVDLGTNNQGASISAPGVGYFAPSFGRPKRMTNVAGLPTNVSGGSAGDGAAPMKGGPLNLSGGDSDGTGDVEGGDVNLRGGAGAGTGRDGPLVIQQGGGLIVVGHTAPTAVSAYWEVHSSIVAKAFYGIPRLTTTQKNGIGSPAAGMMVYDVTLGKLCIYTSAWETITSA